MRKFSCSHFFSKVNKSENSREKILEKFYVNDNGFTQPCSFEQSENEIDFAPEKHLINEHGFISAAPEKIRRNLEVQLCRLIEESLLENEQAS